MSEETKRLLKYDLLCALKDILIFVLIALGVQLWCHYMYKRMANMVFLADFAIGMPLFAWGGKGLAGSDKIVCQHGNNQKKNIQGFDYEKAVGYSGRDFHRGSHDFYQLSGNWNKVYGSVGLFPIVCMGLWGYRRRACISEEEAGTDFFDNRLYDDRNVIRRQLFFGESGRFLGCVSCRNYAGNHSGHWSFGCGSICRRYLFCKKTDKKLYGILSWKEETAC